MSVEKAIREKHAFRDRLLKFLSTAEIMTNDEIEIALGRLADVLHDTKNEDEQLNLRLKLAGLKVYFDLRMVGEVVQDIEKRSRVDREKVITHYATHSVHRKELRNWTAKAQSGSRLNHAIRELRDYIQKNGIDELVEAVLLDHLACFQLFVKGAEEQKVTPEEIRLLTT